MTFFLSIMFYFKLCSKILKLVLLKTVTTLVLSNRVKPREGRVDQNYDDKGTKLTQQITLGHKNSYCGSQKHLMTSTD